MTTNYAHRRACCLTLLLVLSTLPVHAQVSSSEAAASLTGVVPESLTVSLLPGAVSFTLSSGSATNSGTASLAATTSWTLSTSRTGVSLYAYFSSASSALAHTASLNTVDIPSSRVEVSINGGSAVALDQTVAFGAAGAGRRIFALTLDASTVSSTRTDLLDLNINLSGFSLPADTYSGILRLRAQATP